MKENLRFWKGLAFGVMLGGFLWVLTFFALSAFLKLLAGWF